MSANVCRLFFDAAERQPSRSALVFPERDDADVLTFAELRGLVERFAGGLAVEGFRPGDRAVVMIPMSPELYVAVLGILAAGGVAMFVDPWIGVRRIAEVAAAAEPRAFLGIPKAHLLRLFHASLRGVPLTIATDAPFARLVARRRMADLAGPPLLAATSAGDVALITYTTGSSGAPKGVVRTHGILAAQHEAIRSTFPAADDDVDMTTFPVFGLSNLASGITTIIPPVDLRRVASADASAVMRALDRYGATSATSSPPFFDRLAEECLRRGSAPAALRRIVTGGAPVTDAQLRAWTRAFGAVPIEIAYGSSEAEPVAHVSAGERLAAEGEGFLAGRPVPGVEIAIIPIVRGPVDAVEPLPEGSIGELVVAGPHVCRTYDRNEAAVRENKIRAADGRVWHRMGDTGWLDGAGRFRLAGRVHTTILGGGGPLHAQLIEERARRIAPEARRIAAIGLPDGDGRDRLLLVIEGAADGARAEAFHDAGIPADAVIVTDRPLPVDPRHNSKIDYAEVRSMVERGELR